MRRISFAFIALFFISSPWRLRLGRWTAHAPTQGTPVSSGRFTRAQDQRSFTATAEDGRVQSCPTISPSPSRSSLWRRYGRPIFRTAHAGAGDGKRDRSEVLSKDPQTHTFVSAIRIR